MTEIQICEWACDSCHTAFYTHRKKHEKALCPECGDRARYREEVRSVVRDKGFEDSVDRVIRQGCREGCWVYEEGVTGRNESEAKEVIEECAIRKLRELLYGQGCPAQGQLKNEDENRQV